MRLLLAQVRSINAPIVHYGPDDSTNALSVGFRLGAGLGIGSSIEEPLARQDFERPTRTGVERLVPGFSGIFFSTIQAVETSPPPFRP
jgi:hypothetical protein